MNGTTQAMHHHSARNSFKWIASSSVMEAIVAIAVIALAIVGLAGVNPLMMAAIATIIASAAILIEGGAFERASSESRRGIGPAAFNAEFLGAVSGIILGILALIDVAPMTLLSVAVLIFGVTFLLSASTSSDRSLFAGAPDGVVLLGLSVSILGLLAVIGLSAATLVLVGLLVLGAASLFGGSMKGFRQMDGSQSRG
jgi:hypothetical protein